MKNIRKLFLCALTVLLALCLSGCGETHKGDIVEPNTIMCNDVLYYELSEDKVKELDLAVDSVSGLTKIGITDVGAWHPFNYENINYGAVYAYPDERYPELVVVMVDYEPRIYRFSGFHDREPSGIEEVKTMFGLKSPESIIAAEVICGELVGFDEYGREILSHTTAMTMSEPEEIAEFFKAMDSLAPTRYNYIAEGTYLPAYTFELELSDGFKTTLTYYPKAAQMIIVGVNLDIGEGMNTWLEANGFPVPEAPEE